jgi:hypothetical protein
VIGFHDLQRRFTLDRQEALQGAQVVLIRGILGYDEKGFKICMPYTNGSIN